VYLLTSPGKSVTQLLGNSGDLSLKPVHIAQSTSDTQCELTTCQSVFPLAVQKVTQTVHLKLVKMRVGRTVVQDQPGQKL
jgi:hypothetical protein